MILSPLILEVVAPHLPPLVRAEEIFSQLDSKKYVPALFFSPMKKQKMEKKGWCNKFIPHGLMVSRCRLATVPQDKKCCPSWHNTLDVTDLLENLEMVLLCKSILLNLFK